jgi:tetratricopeptide (TPR) repeat protein
MQAGTMGARDIARILAERAHQIAPDDSKVKEVYAIATFEAGAYGEAATIADEVPSSGIRSPALEYLSCEATRRDGRPEEATTKAEQALQRSPDDVRLVVALANAQLDSELAMAAIATVDRALARNQDSRELHDVAARAAEAIGNQHKQLEHERRLFELSPNDAGTEIRYASTLLKAGERKRGQDLLIDVLARNPRNAVARRKLAETGRLPMPWRIATAIGPAIIVVLVLLLLEPPGRPDSGSGIGPWLMLGAYWLTAAAKRAWLRKKNGANWKAVREAVGSVPMRANRFWAKWGLQTISAIVALIVATVLTMSYDELPSFKSSLGWPPWLVWVVVLAGVLSVCLLMFWIGGLRTKPPAPSPFKRLPIDLSSCRCEDASVLVGADAITYGTRHLHDEFEDLAADIATARCDRTGRSWLRVAAEAEGSEAPILMQVTLPRGAERVGVYL